MSAMSNYLENKIIDHVFRGVSFSMPTNLYVALYTAAPSDAVGGTEVAGSNYARAGLAPSIANWAATNGATLTTNPSSGTGATTSNNVAIPFNVPSGSWGTVTHFAVFDSLSGGNMLFWGALSASKLIQSGDTVSIPISQLQVQLDD
jgi:hypothetical protein